MSITKRIPSIEKILPVYAVIAVVIYTWSIFQYFWNAPSWILYSTIGEFITIYAYMVVVNFIESLLILLVPVLMSIILPAKWFYTRFESKGVLLVSLGLGYLLYLNQNLYGLDYFPLELVSWMPVVAIAILVLVFALDRIDFLCKILLEIANRLVVFLYILIPISLISLSIVLIRNIF